MSIDFTNDEEEKRLLVPQQPKLKLITGGKGPPTNPDWLSNLNEGDIFLARHHKQAEQNFELNIFRVMMKTGKSVKLMIQLVDTDQLFRWVDPKVFSREMIFQEVIGNANDEPTGGE